MDIPCVVGMLTEDCRRPLLPQPSTGAAESARCKRRLYLANGLAYVVPQQQQHHQGTLQGQPPTAVAKRNERERRRVRMVNLGFNALRQHVPNGAKNKKLSKVETLRSAIEYIRQLQDVVTETDSLYDDRSENYSPSAPSLPPPPPPTASAHYHLQHLSGLAFAVPQQQNYGHLSSAGYSAASTAAAASSGCSTASSPSPSLGSTESQSPQAPEHFSSSEEEFLAINTWLA